jgi:hypothetical protein
VPVENQQNLTCDSVIQLKAVSVLVSQNEAVSVVWLTEYAVLSYSSENEAFSVQTSHRTKLFLSYSSQNEAVSVIQFTE